MKTEISRDSHQPDKRYSGVYQQQGRMLTDADWNELVEILKTRLDDALRDITGQQGQGYGGTPRHRPLKPITAATDVFRIQPGTIYADGIAARMPDSNPLAYDNQPDFPLPPPLAGNYVLYADIWERNVNHWLDPKLRDQGLHGADTTTRKQTLVQIKSCPYNAANPARFPAGAAVNPRRGNARLDLTLTGKTTEPDPCDPCADTVDVDGRVGNYLFRVEVHQVEGNADAPTGLTLKWSSENAAETFPATTSKQAMPNGFIDDQWIYEFYNDISERHLGVHLGTAAWQAARGNLVSLSNDNIPIAIPVIPGTTHPLNLVRRWDGYCRINLQTAALINGKDKGIALKATNPPTNPGDIHIDTGGSLDLVLNSIRLKLELANRSFVAGDYWLVEVREAVHDPADPAKNRLMSNARPQGIEHRYLAIGRVENGVLQPNPELDRKYAFPPLTEMTQVSIAGGDGQQAKPGHPLVNPLSVNVTNGEWPVNGAWLRFQLESGGGSLEKPVAMAVARFQLLAPGVALIQSAGGVCDCHWTLGLAGEQRVSVTLLDADAQPGQHPSLRFSATLNTAAEVAYIPECPAGVNSVHSLLDADNANVNWPAFDAHGHTSVKHALDTLLCKLQADKLPYTASAVQQCWQELDSGAGAVMPETVQQAIDRLACAVQTGCCTITVSPGDDLQQKLLAIGAGSDLEICFRRGDHLVAKTLDLTHFGHVVLRGCGSASRILASDSESAIKIRLCRSVEVSDLALQTGRTGDSGDFSQLSGVLDILDVERVTITQTELTCPAATAQRSASCLRIAYSRPDFPRASIRVNHCHLHPGRHQVGILLINAGRAQIDDNEIRVRAKAKHWSLKTFLQNPRYRDGFRNILAANLSFSARSSISGVWRNVGVSFESRILYFATDPVLVQPWLELFKNNPPAAGVSDHQLIEHVRQLADRVLLAEGNVGIFGFAQWYQSMSSGLPAIADQGIVCGGRSASDLRIVDNTIVGAAQGIHIGLSHTPSASGKPDLAQRVQIRGNHITTYLSPEISGERHGIFVGSCDSLDIASNYLQAEFFPYSKIRPVDGIRIIGTMGRLVRVRQNHVEYYPRGAYVDLRAAHDVSLNWQVVDNVLGESRIQPPPPDILVERNS